MGVRGLKTFLEQHSRKDSEAAFRFVNVPLLVKNYQIKTGENPKIVVDAQSCYRTWYGDIDWLAGYQVKEFIHRLQWFVESFEKLDVELVFFFGGFNPEKKRKTWLERQRNNIVKIHKTMDKLKDDRYSLHEYDFRSPVLPIQGLVVSHILKYVLGYELHLTIDECDEEVIKYAHEHKCLAILGQDTDFVVSQVEAMALSSEHLTVGETSTYAYDREKLARQLGIRREQLPLLALLAGNDLVPYKDIQNFHRRLCNSSERPHFKDLMPAIGRYINELPKNESIDTILQILAEDLFGDPSRVKLLETSYKSYFVEKSLVDSIPTDHWSKILREARYRYRKGTLPNPAYSVLSQQIFEGGSGFEDLREYHNDNTLTRHQPSYTVLRPLRLRLYGILLSEKRGKGNVSLVTVKEWCGENANSFKEPVFVKPLEPKVHHPGLMALWNDDNNEEKKTLWRRFSAPISQGRDISETRWRLFLTSISSRLEVAQWRSFDDELILVTLAVYYLYEVEYLNELELDAVLITIATIPAYDREKLKTLLYSLNVRATHIGVTLSRTYALVIASLATCGYPIPLSKKNAYLNFEGKLFQKKFKDVVDKKEDLNNLCENNNEYLEVFHKMKKLITTVGGAADSELGEDSYGQILFTIIFYFIFYYLISWCTPRI